MPNENRRTGPDHRQPRHDELRLDITPCDNKKGYSACERANKFGAVLTAMLRYGAESVYI
jgi:hypothetical protein